MNIYALNKIFVEGESDKRFIDFLLNTFYEIIDADLVIDVKGKDKLKDNPLLIDERRKSEGAKNLIIFDTDFDNSTSKGGREKRLEEYINLNCPFIKNFDYEINEDESEITIKGFYLYEYDSDHILSCISDIEEILDAKQTIITSIKDSCTCSYKFNKK